MGEDSLWDGIKKLTGSHHLTYDIQKNEVQVERYWTPQYQENTSGIEDLVLDAINKVKVSDVPVYVFLSGGIDSTLVASQCSGMSAVHLNGPEYAYAKRAADRFGLKLIQVNPEEIEVEKSLQDFAFQFGEPCMAALIPYITAKEVSKYAKVAISANSADELFFGYDRTRQDYTDLKHIFRWPLATQLQQLDLCHFWHACEYGAGRWKEIDTYVQYDLNKTLDAASMCHSLEVRSPFLDHRLVEMALSIPEGRHIDMRLGRKAILKRMLQNFGFDHEFLTRPKQGFSLFSEPKDLELLKVKAWAFVKQNGFLECNDKQLNGRDKKYLEMSALSFWQWYEVWKNKL
jgi:asparagine synthase (glutamine-hydrolysing)